MFKNEDLITGDMDHQYTSGVKAIRQRHPTEKAKVQSAEEEEEELIQDVMRDGIQVQKPTVSAELSLTSSEVHKIITAVKAGLPTAVAAVLLKIPSLASAVKSIITQQVFQKSRLSNRSKGYVSNIATIVYMPPTLSSPKIFIHA